MQLLSGNQLLGEVEVVPSDVKTLVGTSQHPRWDFAYQVVPGTQ